MCKLVGVVQERGHHPSRRQHEVSCDDLRRDDVPLCAQGVLVQVKDLDLVLDKLFAAHGAEDVPMQGGVSSIVHIVHVGEIGRRQLAPGHHTAPQVAHQCEEARQGRDACKGGAHDENWASVSMERTKPLKSTDLLDVGRVVWRGLLTAKCEWREGLRLDRLGSCNARSCRIRSHSRTRTRRWRTRTWWRIGCNSAPIAWSEPRSTQTTRA